jgi:hypothetical protein
MGRDRIGGVAGLWLLAIVAVAACTAEGPGVTILTGPTPIPGGDAQGATDLTLSNDRLAVSFAVETAPPWGVARGGIVDVASVNDGRYSADRASLVDFMPNDWSEWPTTYQVVTIEKATRDEAVVRTERDWGNIRLVTTYGLRAGDNRLHLVTEMTNPGDEPVRDLSSGYVLWPDGGHIFGIPGLGGREAGETSDALSGWSAFYGEDWLLGLHADFDDRINNASRDRYRRHDLAAGETRRFEAWLQVDDRGELAPLVVHEIARLDLPAGRATGQVTDVGGEPVDNAAVVAERLVGTAGEPYAWVFPEDGAYSFDLPAGTYRLRAVAKGYSGSAPTQVSIGDGDVVEVNFADLRPPGELEVRVVDEQSGAPLDARITIEEGHTPLIGYFGTAVHFTDLSAVGRATLTLPPGEYRLRISGGEGFKAAPVLLDVGLASGESREVVAVIDVIADPAAEGWYGADLHHHSDVLDGYTEPHYVLRSELAAGLDVAFLSDHDSVVNNAELARLAAGRDVPFIAATEFSPSWAHFNAYPLDADATIEIEVGGATVQEIFAEARRMGADVVQVNHPYIDYGYFRARENESIPGGYSGDFDLVEISASEPNEKTIPAVWQLWNAGQRAYFTAGSDAHDVWQEISGAVRMYVHVDGEFTVDGFIDGLKRGRSYATAGPLVYPDIMFGDDIAHTATAPLRLSYSIQAVLGLARVTLVGRGEVVETKIFDVPTDPTSVSFTVYPDADGWYALVVEDANANTAYTNPVWVTVSD